MKLRDHVARVQDEAQRNAKHPKLQTALIVPVRLAGAAFVRFAKWHEQRTKVADCAN